MAKCFLSPSNQRANKYSYGNYTEDVICGQIAQACKKALERCGITVGLNHYGSLAEKCNAANNGGYDAFVSIHSNAHNGAVTGTRIFTYGNGVNETKLAKCIFDVLAPYTPGTSENIKPYPELYEMKATKMAACLVEVDFHDVPSVAKWIVGHTTEIGEKIAEGICKYYGIRYVATNTNSNSNANSKMYRVVCGSFEKRTGAEKRQKELKAKGFDSFIDIK